MISLAKKGNFVPMSQKTRPGQRNPERIMLAMFPLISLGLFVVGAFLWWLVQTVLGH